MKIIYHDQLSIKLSEYGILIPIQDNRSMKCFSSLKELLPKLCEVELKNVPAIEREDLKRSHHVDFVERFFDTECIEKELMDTFELLDSGGNLHRYNPENALYSLSKMKGTILKQVGGTYLAMENALVENFCFFLGGGMHHAMSFGGRGFCPVNDIVIGLRKLQAEDKAHSFWVIDTDAHKGDGTAEITESDTNIQTLSIHMAKGWPLDNCKRKKEKADFSPWMIPSNVDLPIESGEEHLYLKRLEEGLHELEYYNNKNTPDLAIVVAGADPYEHDELLSSGKIRLTKEQLLKRDLLVYDFLKKRRVPQCWLMAGGYGKRSHEIYTQFLKAVLL